MPLELTRRSLITWLAGAGAVAAAGGLAACGGDGAPTTGGPATSAGAPGSGSAGADGRLGVGGGATEAQGTASRATSPTSPVGAGALLTPFALDLHRAVGAGGRLAGANLACSPASVAFALAMTRNGAAGQTAAEMDRVLHVSSLEQLNNVLNALDAALATRSGTRQAGFNATGDVTLALANALWGQRDVVFRPPFLDALSASYGAAMHLVDYRADPASARRTINAWVAERTAQRIPELIAEGVIDDATRLVLTNAVYLKAPWDRPFQPEVTSDQPFTTLSGKVVQVPMMAQAEQFPYAAGQGWQAVELPYVGRELAMTLIVADPGRFAAMEASIDLAAVTAALRPAPVSVAVPRWTFRTQVSLEDVLAALGMPTAFTDRADFSLMAADLALAISAVVHEAFVAVDEKGTEAAAATAVAVSRMSAPLEQVTVNVDRPFLFAIRDLPTQTVLFLGRVVDPSAR